MFPQVSPATALAIALPLTYVVWHLSGRYLYAYFTRKTTVVYELRNLGKARSEINRIKGTAVIIGGSIAGLWSARVAADHFEEVIIVEPETWLADTGKGNLYNAEGMPIFEGEAPSRARVAQYPFVHNFQTMSYHALKRYFPDLHQETEEAGGRIGPYYINCYIDGKELLRAGKQNPKAEILQSFFLSRDGYERLLRRLVLKSSSRIKWVTGTVTGFNIDSEDTSMISSVEIRGPDNKRNDVTATLVADCSGSTQIGLKLLRRIASEHANTISKDVTLSWDELRVTYDSGIRYKMFRFQIPTEILDSLPVPGGYHKNSWFFTALPVPGKTNLVISVNRIEGHRIDFFCGGWGDPEVPDTMDDIRDWLKAFEATHVKVPDWLYELLDILLENRDQCQSFNMRTPEHHWTHWESAPYVPSNFVAVGDSVQANNPTYGQGCTKAAVGAVALDGVLRKKPYYSSTSIVPGFGRQFFKRHSEVLEPLWEGTKPTDYMFPATKPMEGETLEKGRFKAVLGNLLMEVATFDDEVDATLLDVRMFMAPPQALFKPRFILKYATFALRKWLGLVSSAAS